MPDRPESASGRTPRVDASYVAAWLRIHGRDGMAEAVEAQGRVIERQRELLRTAKGFLASSPRSHASAELVEDIHEALAAGETETR
jgi:hypothetical protein